MSYKMFHNKEYCQSKILYEYARNTGEYNNVFVDECCLRWQQKGARSDGYYFLKCAALPNVQNLWVALHRVSSYRYSSSLKGQPNFRKFQSTFQEGNFELNLRNPKDIQEVSVSNLDAHLKKQVACIPENIIRGVAPITIGADPDDKDDVTRAVEEAFDHYLNKENNKEKIILTFPSCGYVAEQVLTQAIKNIVIKFSSKIKFFAYFAFAEYDDLLKNIQRELTPVAPSPYTSAHPSSQHNISLDINTFLDEKENACLLTDYLMMEGYEAPTIISIFGELFDETIVANFTKTNICCRCTSKLILVTQST